MANINFEQALNYIRTAIDKNGNGCIDKNSYGVAGKKGPRSVDEASLFCRYFENNMGNFNEEDGTYDHMNRIYCDVSLWLYCPVEDDKNAVSYEVKIGPSRD